MKLNRPTFKKIPLTETLSCVLLCASAITLVALQLKLVGSIITFLGIISLFITPIQFRRYVLLLFLSLLILGYSPVSSDISYGHMVQLLIGVSGTLLLPYLVSRYLYKEHLIKFPIFPVKKWSLKRSGYLVFTVAVSYLLFTLYFATTNAEYNWPVDNDPISLFNLFMGTMILGLWDELFFICTVLGVLKRYLPFHLANLIQAVLFSSFLYQIGFHSWGILLTFLFAVTQGYVYHRTNSLFYVISIHLTIDLVLFFMLLHTHGIL